MDKKRLILVDWQDISSDSSWHCEEEIKDCVPFDCQTVGWEMHSDKKVLRVASTRSSIEKYADIMAIPRSNVRKIIVLKQ
jgi:hypothetical protein